MRYLVVAGLVVTLTLLACAAPKGGAGGAMAVSEGGGPQFRCQLSERLSPKPDSLRLVAAVSVPYDNLIFLRVDSGFAAAGELAISVFRDGSGLYAERINALTATAPTYSETNSRTRNAVHVDEFLVPPGSYQVRMTLTVDRQSRKKSKWEGDITLKATDPLLRLSDIFWISEDRDLAELGVPRVVESFATSETEAHARVQLYSSGPNKIRLGWTLVNEGSDTLQSKVDTLVPTPDIQTHEFTLKIEGLPARGFTLKVEADGNGRRETRARSFTVRIPGIPTSIVDLEHAVRQLKYVATTEENGRLRRATPMEREQLFKDFWKRRDPTPNTEENELMEEYYQRVEYANEKFATNREGWETDRGRIYVLYGEPTDVERHPFELESRPYEIWFYSNLGRRFIFVDYTGFGDYTLVSPEWGY